MLTTLFLAAALATSLVPDAETEGLADQGDSDDPALWVHPTDPTQSLILGTYKDGGLAVFDLSGRRLQFLAGGEIDNVDLRGNLAVASDKLGSVHVYAVDPETRLVRQVHESTPDFEPYGICMYRGAEGRHYAFVTTKQGRAHQLALETLRDGTISTRLVRTLEVGTQVEGCVADDRTGHLYVSEESRGVWRFEAEPDASAAPVLVAAVASGELTADVEGVTIYEEADGTGYLLVSSQGSSEYFVYDRLAPHAYRGRFKLKAGDGIDKVSKTDGLAVTSAPMGPLYPRGLLVVHDDENGDDAPNFKLVGWGRIADALRL